IAEALPPLVASVMQPAELQAIQERLKRLPEPPARAGLSMDDWRGAAGVFLLVFLATLPVSVPFMLMSSAASAMRVSNGIAIALLFGLGVAFGRCTGRSPWGTGTFMVILGAALVALTIALGG
ncbi:MAG: VIT1/CCC1 transporter family protein, partial [Phycisphaerae bacterium]|nr:VIT1/CCC1 transporter family protein [Phycisphaerae bacterium]